MPDGYTIRWTWGPQSRSYRERCYLDGVDMDALIVRKVDVRKLWAY